MRRLLLLVVGVALGLALLAFLALRQPAVQDAVLERVVARLVASQPDGLFRDDALRVLVCGSGSPFPHATRAAPCTAVFAGGRFYVVDVGPRSWNNLALWRVDGSRIGAVLLTHFHSDHIGELGEWNLQTWVAGRPEALPVIGPPGVERVVAGFQEAYALDAGYRVAHHGAELVPPELAGMRARVAAGPAAGKGPEVVWQADGLTVTAFAVDHAPIRPALGYRFDYRGRSVVVSGDTVPTETLLDLARGADVLVHDALAPHLVGRIHEAAAAAGRRRVAKITGDIPDYHASPVQAAELANRADVGLLVLSHLVPPPPIGLVERIFVRGVAEVRPEGWVVAHDGLLVELPADSEALEVGTL